MKRINLLYFLLIIFILNSLPVFADLNSQFIDAAVKGNLKQVKQLLNSGVDVNAEKYGKSVLTHAVMSRQKKVARHLIKIGADINSLDDLKATPLWWAVKKELFDIARLMIEKGGNINIKPKNGDSVLGLVRDAGFVRYLLSKGARAKKEEIIKACKYKKIEILKQFLESDSGKEVLKNNGFILLKSAVRGNKSSGGSIEKVKLLLSKGIQFDPKSKNGAKLLVASAFHNDDPAITKLILEKGVNINSRAYGNETALIVASGYGHPIIVAALLDAGADVDTANELGTTALINAVRRSDIGKKDRPRYWIMELLLKAGPKINAAEKSGWTSLHYAVTLPNFYSMKLLLSNNARINSVDARSRTPLRCALERKAEFTKTPHLRKYLPEMNRVIQYLRQKGAR